MADLFADIERVQDPAAVVAAPPVAPKASDSLWGDIERVAPPTAAAPAAPRRAEGLMENIEAGFQASVPALAWRRKLPDLVMDPEHSKWWERLAGGLAQVVPDLSVMVPGGIVGATAGTAVGGPVGTIVGAGVGSFGPVDALRASLMEAYRSGEVKDGPTFWSILREGALGFGKGAVIGAATFGAGAVAKVGAAAALGGGAEVAAKVGLNQATMASRGAHLATGAADVAAQIAAMTTMPRVFEEGPFRWPEAREFADATAIILALKGAHVGVDKARDILVQRRLEDTYAKTGKTPAEQVAEAQADPQVASELAEAPRGTLRMDRLLVEAERLATPGPVLPKRLAELATRVEEPAVEPARNVPIEGLVGEAERLANTIPEAPRVRDLIRDLKKKGPLQTDVTDDIQSMVAAVERLDRLEAKTRAAPASERTTADGKIVKVPARRASKLSEAEVAERDELKARVAELEAKVDSTPTEAEHEASAKRVFNDAYARVSKHAREREKNVQEAIYDKPPEAIARLVQRQVETMARMWGVLPEEIYKERFPSFTDVVNTPSEKQARMPKGLGAPKVETLIGAIKRRGGIDLAQIRDLTGEGRAGSGRSIPPGLFHRRGRGLDELANELRDDGFEIHNDPVDGGVARLREMISDEINGTQKHYSLKDQQALTEHERKLDEHYMTEHEKVVTDEDAVAKANEIDEGAVERAAMKYSDDDAGFMGEIRRIIDGTQGSEKAVDDLYQSARKEQFETPELKRWFGDSKVVDANGLPLVVFHGTARPDRIGTRFRKDRATSGPMAFFTDDPAIASNYAKGKPDTSLDGTESAFENYFLFVPKGGRTQRSIVQKWWDMTPAQRAKFNEIMPRLRENEETGKLEDGGSEGGMAGAGTYEMYLREGHGNGIKAAIDLWLSSGAMFDREEGFLNVMKMAGVDMKGVEYVPQGRSMDAVYPVYLAISKPLDTLAVSPDVVSALEAASKKARASRTLDSGDPWDKRRRFTPSEWIDTLKEDMANGKNSFVWTSIPDWVTRALEKIGYDGIRDTGGKMGGEGHDVWVPFRETQVKSAIGNRGTFDPENSNILRQSNSQKESEAHLASYQVNSRLISTFEGANKSSILHELGHHFLEDLKFYAAKPNAPERVKEMWDTARREFAISEANDIPSASHELMARSFERYLADGEAPTPAMKSMFSQFKDWMLSVYKDIKNLAGVNISPEVKRLFDRMLATDEEIKAAQELNVPRAYVNEAKATEARKIVPGAKAEQASMEPFADEAPKGPGQAPDTTRVNYAFINSPLDVKLAMERLAEIDQANIQTQRGGTDGVKSWAEANAEQAKYVNDILGGSPDTLRLLSERDPNLPGPDVKLGILKKLAVGAANDSARLRDEVLAAGHDATVRQQLEYMGSIERARMIQAEFLGERASVARALNALKDTTEGTGEIGRMLEAIGTGDKELYQSRTPEQEQAYMKAQLDEIMLKYRGKSVLDIARLHKEIGTLKGTFKMVKEIEKATTWEMVVEAWKAGLLSGPQTPITNLVGTSTFQFLRPAVDMLAVMTGMARGARVGMGEADRASMAEPLARLIGMLGGVQEGLKVGYHAFKADDPTAKVEAYRNAIPGRVGEIVRLPYRLMSAGDAITTTMYKRGELRTLAIRKTFDEGNFGPASREFAERVQELVDKPTAEMELIADEAATRMAFNSPGGDKMRAIQGFVNNWHLQWMIPFIRTPLNVTAELGRMSPFAPLVKSWRDDIAKGGVARDRAIAELTLGSGIMAVTAALAFAGQISGSGSPDPGKNRGKAGVWQPNSVLVGDTWYEIGRMQPTGTLMVLAADMANAWDHMTDEEKDKVPKILALAFSNAVTNQTFLQGLTNLVNAMSEPARFGPRFMQQLAASMVPNIIGQPTTMTDPYVREVSSMLDAIQARIPGARQQLMPKRDWLGEPVQTKERLGAVLPVREQKISDDKVRLEAAKLDLSLSGAPKKIHLGSGTGKLGYVEITQEEREKFQVVAGEMTHKVLSQIVNGDAYDRLRETDKKKIFARVIEAAHRIAAISALQPEKRDAYLRGIIEKIQDQP